MTRFGRYTYAIGSNDDAARRAGINVDRHLIKVYAMSGFLAGWPASCRSPASRPPPSAGTRPTTWPRSPPSSSAARACSAAWARSLGTVIGVFIPAILQNGFVIVGVQPFWQSIAVGAVLVAAVYIDQLRRRAQERGERR